MFVMFLNDLRVIRNFLRVNFLGMCKICFKENVKLLKCG